MMLANGLAAARVVVLVSVALGGVSLSTSANAASGGNGHHHTRDRTVGQKNSTLSSRSPVSQRGVFNSSPTSAGGQNSTMNALCRKGPCRITQKVNMVPWDVSAFISLSPTDFLVIP